MCLNAKGGVGRIDGESETFIPVAHALRAEGFDASEDGTGRGTPLVPVFGLSGELTASVDVLAAMDADHRSDRQPVVAFSCKDNGRGATTGAAPTLRSMGHADSHQNGGGQLAVATGWAVRRLTPRECERLQGFPDDYTLVPTKRGLMADGPRYKMLGNSMACNVMRWIGWRIEAVEAIPATAMLEAAE